MTWKKLVIGGASGALLIGWGLSLSNCTVCTGPQCFNGTDSGGTDSPTNNEGSAGDSGNDSGSATCSAIKPQGPLFFDNVQGTGMCDKCMTAKCCSEAQACVAQMGADSCSDYLDCLGGCSDSDGGIDPMCASTCVSGFPMGKSVADTMSACSTSKCAVECK